MPLFDNASQFTYNFSNLLAGNYTLAAILNYNDSIFQNSTEFIIKNTEMFYEKNQYSINETIYFRISGLPEKQYNLTFLGPIIETFAVTTDDNGVCLFNTSFETPGNYTIELEGLEFYVEILPMEVEEVEPNLYLSVGNIFDVNETISLTVRGTPDTNYTLTITSPLNTTVFDVNDVLNTDGNSYTTNLITPGTYVVEIKYLDKNITRTLDVVEKEINFIISLSKKQFPISEPVNFTIFGPINTDFITEIKTKNQTLIYDFTTDKNGIFPFSSKFDFPDNYTINIILNGVIVATDDFEIYQENITEIINETMQLFNYTMNVSDDEIVTLPFYAMRSNAYYYLSNDLESTNDGIIFSSMTNITLDCQGNKIHGLNTGYGVKTENSYQVTLLNCNIENFDVGMLFKDSNNNILNDNTVSKNKEGVLFLDSNDNILTNNTVIDNSNQGILFYSSFNNTVLDNIVKSSLTISTLEKIETLAKN
jgi:parallel beta-helix repeat protein